jgi:hypothetical protein
MFGHWMLKAVKPIATAMSTETTMKRGVKP